MAPSAGNPHPTTHVGIHTFLHYSTPSSSDEAAEALRPLHPSPSRTNLRTLHITLFWALVALMLFTAVLVALFAPRLVS